MAYKPHYLVSWGGTIKTGSTELEQWTNTLRGVFINNTSIPDDAPDTETRDQGELEKWLADTAFPRLREFMQRSESGISAAAVLEWVKVNKIGPDGRYAEAFTAGLYDAAVRGGGGNLVYPLQVSVAITTETNASRGLASRGRFYLPTPTLPLDGTANIDGTALSATIESVSTLLEGLGDYSVSEVTRFVPCVVSKGGVKSSTGVSRIIRSVSADTRFDIQRSRAEQQDAVRLAGEPLDYGTV